MSTSPAASAGRRERVLRPTAPPVAVAEPGGLQATTRLRVTPAEDAVLAQVAEVISVLRRRDLAVRCRSGAKPGKEVLAARKRALTGGSSSRWAGSIVRHNDAGYRLARRNQVAYRDSLRQALVVIEARLALPCPVVDSVTGKRDAPSARVPGQRKKVAGYANPAERADKQRRLQHLRAEMTRTQMAIDDETVSIVEGGRRLARIRHHLDQAGLTEQDWRDEWDCERTWFHANGSPDEPYGNLTITIAPDGTVSIRLPKPLEHLANAPRGRYALSGRAVFAHRGDAWAAHIAPHADGRSGAVSYRFHRKPGRAGWYVTASWTPPPPVDPASVPVPGLDFPARLLGVDTNADHLACCVLDEHGNPDGAPIRIDLDLTGPASRRDAQLRHAITRLVRVARQRGCAAIAVEDLGFDDARSMGRETMGRGRRGKAFRRTVAGIPTQRLRSRLAAMVAASGLVLLGVDPAYTSKWGAQHWQKPMRTPTHEATRHEAAAVVIGRRAQGHRARRRAGKPVTDQRIASRRATTQTKPGPARVGGRTTRKDRPHDGRVLKGSERRSASRATVTPALTDNGQHQN